MTTDRRLHARLYHFDEAPAGTRRDRLLRRAARMTADRRLHVRSSHVDVTLQGPDETVFFDV